MVADPFAGTICPPWQARFVYAVERPLRVGPMQQAAAAIRGEHNFTSFAAFDPDRSQRIQAGLVPAHSTDGGPNNERTIYESEWKQEDESRFTYRVTGDGFLHHMVRNLVGTFLEVGWGERAASSIPTILHGLFLDRVFYRGP
jgi:tRNA pseudouridine38-40 synthase